MHYQRVANGLPMNTPAKGSVRKDSETWEHKGYLYLRTADGRVVAEHRYVMERHLGRRLLATELVHHKNENKTDNSIDNLMLIDTQTHTSLHRAHRGPCMACGVDDIHGAHCLCALHSQAVFRFMEKNNVPVPDDPQTRTIVILGIGLVISSNEIEDRIRALKK
jgi:hypothetical protein